MRTVLETARDGEDLGGPALRTLLAHVRGESVDALATAAIDLDETTRAAWGADPGAARGRAVRVRGRLEQRTGLEPGVTEIDPVSSPADRSPAEEWFVRTADGTPVLVVVAAPPSGLDPGDPVEVVGRFWRIVGATGRDGVARDYLGIVAPTARRAAAGAGPASPPGGSGAGLVVGLAAALVGTVLVGLRLALRRGRRGAGWSGARPRPADDRDRDAAVDDTLPPDPADALDELRRRAADPEPEEERPS